MHTTGTIEVIIIGGSYAGLSAGMALGRAMRKTLIVDSGKPCNRHTPHSHNFLSRDGERPADLKNIALEQVLAYPTVHFMKGTVSDIRRMGDRFEVVTKDNATFTARKILFATGLSDNLPPLNGLASCWGISAIHCPYCHGYEVRDMPSAVLGKGDTGFELAGLISHWTPKLTLLSNGAHGLDKKQVDKLRANGIDILEGEIARLDHSEGHISAIRFTDGALLPVNALYVRPSSAQHSRLPEKTGCRLNAQGLIETDAFQRTSEPGIFAAGDCAHMMRSVSYSVAGGSIAGAAINNEMISEDF